MHARTRLQEIPLIFQFVDVPHVRDTVQVQNNISGSPSKKEFSVSTENWTDISSVSLDTTKYSNSQNVELKVLTFLLSINCSGIFYLSELNSLFPSYI